MNRLATRLAGVFIFSRRVLSKPSAKAAPDVDAYIRTVAFLSSVDGVIAACLMGLAVLVICDMVVERYILNLTTIWQIDVVTYSTVAATFIGSAYVLMTRGHVNVDILPIHLGSRARGWLALFTILVALSF